MFIGVPELIETIDGYIAEREKNRKPFIWTGKASDILEKVEGRPRQSSLVAAQNSSFNGTRKTLGVSRKYLVRLSTAR